MAIVVVLLLLIAFGGKASIAAPGATNLTAGTRPPTSPQAYPGYNPYLPNPYAYGTYNPAAPDPTTTILASGVSALGSFLSKGSSGPPSTTTAPSSAFTDDSLLAPSFSADGSSSSSSSAVYQPGDSFSDYTAGLFGPGINADGTGA